MIPGEGNPHAKLTRDAVVTIRREYPLRRGAGGTLSLAREFGIHPRTVRRIATGERWQHVIDQGAPVAKKWRTLAERFWEKVETKESPQECWNWTSRRNRYGYGTISSNRIMILAHRVSYELHHGPIPAGLHVLHTCDHPSCVNPAHLFLGTHADNMRDMAEKGRARGAGRGERHYNAKLTTAQVVEIRTYAGPLSQRDLGLRYGVSPSHISQIRSGRTWRHV